MFEGKTVLITGGTGSLGRALTKKLLDLNAKTVRIFSIAPRSWGELGWEYSICLR